MKIRYFFYLFFFSSLFADFVAFDSLHDLLDYYRKHSPMLALEASKKDLVKAEAESYKAYPAPELSLEWGSQSDMYYGGVTVSQEFLYPGKRKANLNLQKDKEVLAEKSYVISRINGELQIAKFYLDFLLVQEKERYLDSNLSSLSFVLETAKNRYALGFSSLDEVFRIESEMSKLKIKNLDLVQERQSVLSWISSLLSLDSIEVKVNGALKERVLDLKLEELLKKINQTPEFQALEIHKKIAKDEIRVAQLKSKPNWMLQASYMVMKEQNDWSLMLGFQLPFFPWASSEFKGSVNEAKVRERSLKLEENNLKSRYEQEIKKAFLAYQNAVSKKNLIVEIHENIIEKAFEASQISYANGKSDLTAVLDSFREKILIQEERSSAYSHLYYSVFNLEQILGLTPGEL